MATNGQQCPAMMPVPAGVTCEVRALPEGHRYHAYISGCDSKNDRPIVQHIQTELRSKGYIILEIRPGEPESVVNSELDKCWKIITIITKDYMSAGTWQEYELANHIEKSSFEKKRLMIPIIHDLEIALVPSYAKEVNYLQTNDEAFWPKLTKALGEDALLSATIPTADIANGLAWGYYYGYLCLILPGIKDRTHNCEYSDIFQKLILLIPKSGYCATDIKEIDSNITSAGYIKFSVTRSGIQARSYNSAVFKLIDPKYNKVMHVIMEYATPLWTMYEMEMGRIAGLGAEDKQKEMDKFSDKLIEILSHTGKFEDKYIIIRYDDKDPLFNEDPHALSRLVAERVRQEGHLWPGVNNL